MVIFRRFWSQNGAIFHVFCDFFSFLFDWSKDEVFKSWWRRFLRQNYLLWPFNELYVLVLQTQTRKMIILIFAIFFKFFLNFCHFLSYSSFRDQIIFFKVYFYQSFTWFLLGYFCELSWWMKFSIFVNWISAPKMLPSRIPLLFLTFNSQQLLSN